MGRGKKKERPGSLWDGARQRIKLIVLRLHLFQGYPSEKVFQVRERKGDILTGKG